MYLITYPEDPDIGILTIVWHPLIHGPIEDYINDSKLIVTEIDNGKSK